MPEILRFYNSVPKISYDVWLWIFGLGKTNAQTDWQMDGQTDGRTEGLMKKVT